MGNQNTATPSPEELLLKREADVTAREKAAEKLERDLSAREEDVNAKAAANAALAIEIQAKEELYSAAPEELEVLRNEVKTLRLQLAKAEDAPAKKTPGEKFKFEGVAHKFKDSAPKSIRIDGVVKTQKELVKDENALLQLVAGNSGLIEKISD